MAGSKITEYLPTRSLVLILACAAGVLGFFLLVTYPSQRKVDTLDQKIADSRAQIEEQKVFLPIYNQLRELQTATDALSSPPRPRKKKGKVNVYRIRSQIEAVARDNRLDIEGIDPDMATIVDDSGRVRIRIVVAGAYSGFRGFIIQLNQQMPTIEFTDSIEIRRIARSKHHRLVMGVWVAQG